MLLDKIQNNAFSLIELLVVMSIIGIVAAVAAPSYKHHVIRGKIAEVMRAAQADVQQMNQYIDAHGLPQNNSDLNAMSAAVKFTAINIGIVTLEDITKHGLRIKVEGGNLPNGLQIYIRYYATETGNVRKWQCTYGGATTSTRDPNIISSDYLYLPSQCHQIADNSVKWF